MDKTVDLLLEYANVVLRHQDASVALVRGHHVLVLIVGALVLVVRLEEDFLVAHEQELILAAVCVSKMLQYRSDWVLLDFVLEFFLDEEKLLVEFC